MIGVGIGFDRKLDLEFRFIFDVKHFVTVTFNSTSSNRYSILLIFIQKSSISITYRVTHLDRNTSATFFKSILLSILFKVKP